MNRRLLLLALPALSLSALADGPSDGHSAHGEAFNEGPRQEAVLMPGLPQLDFPISTTKPIAQRFFLQGVAQLHGFWYFEAERSFRQAAAIDPDCAMAYWGMAMANVNNETRAKAFLAEAVARKASLTPREKLWLTQLETFYPKDDKRDKKQRTLDAIRDLEAIVQAHPNDIEAKAFLVWKIWAGKNDAPISSPMAVDALLDQIFAANPAHPAHHYRIHLWDGFNPEQGLGAAAACGPAAPAIAHMWHMPGHIYSKLNRFDDAVWQQETSTRLDHAHMIRHQTLPDQTHNYAHNEEWLIRNYNELGRVKDAIALAKSLIATPRHPKLNTLDKKSSTASYGRTRLIDTLTKWELWRELLAFADSLWLSDDAPPAHQTARLRALASAYFALNQAEDLRNLLAPLEQLAAAKPVDTPTAKSQKGTSTQKSSTPDQPAKTTDASDPSSNQKKSPAKAKPTPAKTALNEVRTLLAVLTQDPTAEQKLASCKTLNATESTRALLTLGLKDQALKKLDALPQDLAGQITRAHLAQQTGDLDAARKATHRARQLAFQMDPTLPAAQRLKDLVALHEKPGTPWQASAPNRTDLGERPPQADLGPLHWHPPAAPPWAAITLDHEPAPSGLHTHQPRILMFYLGASCSHCVQQLNAFSKSADAFKKAGLALQAIAPGTTALVQTTFDVVTPPGTLPFPLLADPSGLAFRAFRAFDDFENQYLHATILLDAQNRMRWFDVSWEPFMDTAFLLKESQRLLSLDEVDTFTSDPPHRASKATAVTK